MNLRKNMTVVALSALVLMSLSCDDTVENRYATRKEAEHDRLFERGWLPVIVPQSIRDIVTINDLDSNTSRGSFYFSGKDAEDFIAELSAQGVPDDKGYANYKYSAGDKVWQFSINKSTGHCKYHFEYFGRPQNAKK